MDGQMSTQPIEEFAMPRAGQCEMDGQVKVLSSLLLGASIGAEAGGTL
jgi:hypothetical protein